MNAVTLGAPAPVSFTFNNHPIRVLDLDGSIWFAAPDVAKVLEYRKASDMTRILDPDERGAHIVRTPSGDQRMSVINESGLYHAVLKSRKPEAAPFRRWVTAEVLPAIRRTGRYETATAQAAAPRGPAFPALPASLSLDDYEAWRDALDRLNEQLAGTPVHCLPWEVERLSGRLGKSGKTMRVQDFVGVLEAHGVPREVVMAATGMVNNTLRQHAFIARKNVKKGGAA